MTMNWMMTIGFTTLSHPGIWIALVLISDHMEKCCFKLAQDVKNPKCSPNLGMGQNERVGGPQILGDVLVLFIMYYMTIDFEYVYVIVYTNVYVYIYIYV